MQIQNGIDLSGRVVIVTGAGSGIGRAMAETFASAGAKVLINDVKENQAQETAERIARIGRGEARVAVADISKEEAVQQFVQETIDRWGRIDVLCNNAGIMDRMERLENVSTASWNRVLAINTTGPFFVTRAVLPHMLTRKYGSIINTASEAGIRGGTAGLAYTVSKHGLVGLTRSVAWAHADDGIRCNAICPGPTETNIVADGGIESFDQEGFQRIMPIIALMPRVTSPQSMANLALFLASDGAAYLNGAIIPVDGGWSAA